MAAYTGIAGWLAGSVSLGARPVRRFILALNHREQAEKAWKTASASASARLVDPAGTEAKLPPAAS
jgi:hypothetical protein